MNTNKITNNRRVLYKGNWSCTVTFPRNCYGGTNPASQNGKTIKKH